MIRERPLSAQHNTAAVAFLSHRRLLIRVQSPHVRAWLQDQRGEGWGLSLLDTGVSNEWGGESANGIWISLQSATKPITAVANFTRS